MNTLPPQRVDEVSRYYRPAQQFNLLRRLLFYVGAAFSLIALYTNDWAEPAQAAIRIAFLVSAVAYFLSGEVLRLHLVPRAEEARRRQLLSDAIGTKLSHDRTNLYYNNDFPPSVTRLGANTMENAFFGRAIAERMLRRKRLTVCAYGLLWLLLFASRNTSLGVLTWVTQVVFSQAILTHWLNLETLRMRFERVYECLHTHFLHTLGSDTPKSVASLLDAFVTYESAKAASGILLSSSAFEQLNPSLSKKWADVRKDLEMDVRDEAPEAAIDPS